ncbi:hypothetical protein BGZ83_006317 [Gryganskiella cystojenkinii]|nr:hypothetical protein BGZ83_006317 [Gryganskiella cystojenkinii]
MALRRIKKEIRELQENPSPFYTASPVSEDDLFLWEATIRGPVGSLYEGGIFPLSIRFPVEYPFRPPRVKYLVKVYHPGINSNGTVCLDILMDQWSPALTLAKVLMRLREPLEYPYPDEPMWAEAANNLQYNPALFNKLAREWTRLYAGPDSNNQRLMIPRVTRHVRLTLTTLTTPTQSSRRLFSTSMTELQRQQHRQRLVVTRTLPLASQARLDRGFEGVDILQWKEDRAIPRSELLTMAKGADGILCLLTDKIDAEVLDAAGPQLKVVSTMSVGYDHVTVADLEARNVKLGITPGVLTEATADTTVLLVLSAARRLREGVDAVIHGKWGTWSPTWLLGSQLTDKTVGIVGLGRIGVAVAKRLQAFGVKKFLYQGTRRKVETEKEIVGADVEFSDMDRLLKESDVICVCCALNDKTKNMFDYSAFSKMKDTVVFVNTARGGIVDQAGLIQALKEGKLGSVGLDVTVPEPLPTNSELLTFPNCIVLPHIGSGTLETRTAMSEIAIENVLSGMKGESLPFPHDA